MLIHCIICFFTILLFNSFKYHGGEIQVLYHLILSLQLFLDNMYAENEK